MGEGEKGLVSEIRKLSEQLKEFLRAEGERLNLEALLCSRTTELIKANEMLLAEINAREKAEQALGEYQYVYRKLLDSISDAVFVADAGSGLIIQANSAAGALIGRPVDEIAGMHQTELHPVEDTEYYGMLFRKAVKDRAVRKMEIMMRHSSGNAVKAEANAFTSVMGGRNVIWGVFRETSGSGLPESERARINLLIDELSRRLSTPSRSSLDLQ
ncbi:MAG: PAS domain-containing protein [Candidatus Methylomirabilis sp.]|nr:PAS domain-containing protein [Deltaproteobacteria bacterium]